MDTSHVDSKREMVLEKVKISFREGRFKAAVLELDQALSVSPDDVALLMLRALARFKQGLWKEARPDFARARKLDESDPETWLGEAMCLALEADVTKAMELFEAMVVRHPGFVRGRIQAARFYFKLVAIAKGQSHLKAALDMDLSVEERREIEALRKEQAVLDQKRIYRPDFEALRRQKMAQARA